MSKSTRIVLTVLGAVGLAGAGAGVARYVGLIGDPPGPRTGAAVTLPLSCRVQGHGWRMPRNSTQTPTRRTCARCQRIDLPLP